MAVGTVGKPGVLRPLPVPGTSRYNDALALIAGMGGSAEAKARMEEIRDARAELDAAHAEATSRIAEAAAAVDAAYREQRLLAEARQRNADLEERLRDGQGALARDRRDLDAQRARDSENLRAATMALDAGRADLAAQSQALDAREIETAALNEAAKSLRDAAQVALDEAAALKAEIERRLGRMQDVAAGR